MSSLLAPATAAAQSADFTLTAGQITNLVLVGAAGVEPDPAAYVRVEYKTSFGTYLLVGSLKFHQLERTLRLTGPGTYRVSRQAQAVAAGVERD